MLHVRLRDGIRKHGKISVVGARAGDCLEIGGAGAEAIGCRAMPHSPLRLARQFRPQGQYRASPRTACRGTAVGDCRVARTDRLAPTVSLLRRAHDHRRDLRAMAATTRATSRDRTDREQPVVTRHGLRLPHAATPPLQRMPPGVPFARIGATGLNVSSGRFPIHGPPGEKSHSPSHHQRQRRTDFAITSIKQNSKSP
jgi:hypothetical protein